MNTRHSHSQPLLLSCMVLTLVVGMISASQPALAADPVALAPAPAAGSVSVGLGAAAPFVVLAGAPAITSSGASTITGDIGISPWPTIGGFPPGKLSGTLHRADRVALQAQSDLATAYADAAGRPATATHATLGGLTLAPGVYAAGGVTLGLTGTLTLDGGNDPGAVWIFQATSDLVTAASSTILLVNGGQACNVFWQVTGSATLGSGSTFVGSILALTSIAVADGVALDGRALARNGEVTLINDTITRSTCSSVIPAPVVDMTTASSSSAALTTRPRESGTDPPVLLIALVMLALAALLGEPDRRAWSRARGRGLRKWFRR